MAAPVVTSPRNPNVSGALNQEGRGATTVRRQVGIYTGDAAWSRPLPVGSPLSAHLVPAQQQQQPSSLPRLLHLQTHTFTSKPVGVVSRRAVGRQAVSIGSVEAWQADTRDATVNV
ncbi:hypothetical protein E2C01_069907 [Portunus trituberculatus]|uniref:Uncharacterized protein n=1 Tax=Portunus trituberculatus TaxID=210409 RepID=A0A5B7I250_PORTR|nr:hypothetical protein [Portunus trituberculatus]